MWVCCVACSVWHWDLFGVLAGNALAIQIDDAAPHAAPIIASDFSEPWKRLDRALVIDAYEYNPIDWQELVSDKRIVGFINKASDGLPPAYRCSGDAAQKRLCKTLWRRHAVAQELFQTRRTLAKALGLKWGAYHLGATRQSGRAGKELPRFRQAGTRRPDGHRYRG